MNLLILGRGKTGSLVADAARQRKHQVSVLCSTENPGGSALTPARLAPFDAVLEFTTPHAVMANIEACIRAGKNVVVGTTGWYDKMPQVLRAVEEHGTGFLYAANFSIGVNLFFDAARTAAAALRHQYFGQIFERHHAQKKDAPSGTAAKLQQLLKDTSDEVVEVVSFREGDVVGMHELILDSPADTIYLCHNAKSRQGFAEGAVRAAEWMQGKKGFFDFAEVWREL